MAEIEVYYSPGTEGKVLNRPDGLTVYGVVNSVQDKIVAIVAEYLSSDDPCGQLNPEDIGFRHDHADGFDRSVYDLEINITVEPAPIRCANLRLRTQEIKNQLGELLPKGLRFSVEVCPYESYRMIGTGCAS